MKKQILSCNYWLALLVALFAVAGCVDDEAVSSSRGVVDENGMVALTVQAQVPGLRVTRAVDGGGEQINSLWLLAFDAQGYMISRVQAENVGYDAGSDTEGAFTAKVPATTRRIHFLSNVIMDNFSDAENIGRHENEVIAPMVSSSGDLVYWGRKTFADENALLEFAGSSMSSAVTLYRNQALVRHAVSPEAQGKGISVKGWAFCNEYAYGTVAPFDGQAVDTDPFHFWSSAAEADDFVTLLPEAYNVKMTDPTEATVQADDGSDPRYVFENPNREDDQMYVIMLIASENYPGGRYYKVLLIDDQKEPIPVVRNHQITVTINDINENYGVDDFEAAKTATPVNNPWISISDEIPEINNGSTTLRIEGETTVIYQEGGQQTIKFYYNGPTKPVVEWTGNDGITDGSAPVVTRDSTTHEGTIAFTTNAPDDAVRRGTLEIREADGILSRRVKVVLCNPFEFTPVWISSEIPLLTDEYVTVLFNIPDDFPQELLPIDVKFGCDLIDAMPVADGGQQLEVVMEETNYGGIPIFKDGVWTETAPDFNPGFNYKYVYSATRTGQHYVQFRTVLTDPDAVAGSEFFVYMEGADSRTNQNIFQRRRLFFAFQEENAARRIMLEGGEPHTRFASRPLTDLDPVAGEEIAIPFTLGTLNGADWSDVVPATLSSTCEIWVYYDPAQVEPTGTWADSQQYTEDYYGNTYVRFKTMQAENEITFRTLQPAYNTNIVLSARSFSSYGRYDGGENPYLGVNDEGFRSASVEIRSQGALDFEPEISVNGSVPTPVSGSYEMPYGEGQTVDLSIAIPEAARGREFTLRFGTTKLEPVGTEGNPVAWADGNGYDYTVNTTDAIFTLHLRTTRVVNTETLTLESGSRVGFNAETIRLTDKPLTGTIAAPDNLPFKYENPNIVLERQSDGARIGVFDPDVTLVNDEAKEADYSLTLRGEYRLHATDKVTVRWSPAYESNDVVCTWTGTLADLLQDNVRIELVEQ